jgi:hypothetical protein
MFSGHNSKSDQIDDFGAADKLTFERIRNGSAKALGNVVGHVVDSKWIWQMLV